MNQKLSRDIIEICKLLHKKNMLASADGNISARLPDGNILITPSGQAKAFVNIADMAIVSLDGEVIKGKPSSERLMHLQIYRSCPDAQAVCHAHPPTAIALSIAKPEWKELPAEAMSELILAVGSLPFVPYARPGTQGMGANLETYLPKHRAMILSRHGALTWGESLTEAYCGMERVEHSCEIIYKAIALGGITRLPEAEVTALKKIREKLEPRIL